MISGVANTRVGEIAGSSCMSLHEEAARGALDGAGRVTAVGNVSSALVEELEPRTAYLAAIRARNSRGAACNREFAMLVAAAPAPAAEGAAGASAAAIASEAASTAACAAAASRRAVLRSARS